MSKTKICSVCGKRRPVADFYADKRAKDGLFSCCKPCQREKGRRSYQAHREKKRAYQKKYYAEHPERRRETVRKSDAKHREKRLAFHRKRRADPEYQARHKAYMREYNKRYYEENQAAMVERSRRWREKNPERNRDPEKNRIYSNRRRAKLLDAYVADVDRDAIILRDLGICGVCSKPILRDHILELDHILPLAAGGTHEPDNIQLAHRTCNRRKHARVDYTPVESAA